MKELVNFFKNRTVQKNLLFAFGGLFIFIQIVFLGLNVYTRHGQALSVPDFNGLNLEEVSKLADQKKLRFQIIDSVFTVGQAPGTVIAQSPSPNSKVKSGRNIFLTINAINPEKIEMPNVVGVSIRQAEATIQTKGLKIGYRRYVPDIAKDYVLRQLYHNREIAPETKIIKGSSIDLVLGKGTGNFDVTTPNLKGLNRNQAQDELSANYLNFGALIYDNSIETRQDSLNAIIWRQKPTSGSLTSTGASVDVWLTVNESKIKPDSTKKVK